MTLPAGQPLQLKSVRPSWASAHIVESALADLPFLSAILPWTRVFGRIYQEAALRATKNRNYHQVWARNAASSPARRPNMKKLASTFFARPLASAVRLGASLTHPFPEFVLSTAGAIVTTTRRLHAQERNSPPSTPGKDPTTHMVAFFTAACMLLGTARRNAGSDLVGSDLVFVRHKLGVPLKWTLSKVDKIKALTITHGLYELALFFTPTFYTYFFTSVLTPARRIRNSF
jgi:hypothetical protein